MEVEHVYYKILISWWTKAELEKIGYRNLKTGAAKLKV